ncbi:MAG: hypothetical protein ACRCY4_08095 [Brevinema sp.]
MKSFISFASNSLGFFYAPKRTIDELRYYYKSAAFPLGLTVSILAMFSYSIAQGISHSWGMPTIFANLIASYLGAFIGGSLILGVMSFFKESIAAKEFWGVYFAADLPLILGLPFMLAAQLNGLGFLQYFAFLAFGWTILLKLFLIQRFLQASFAKAVILWVAPIFFLGVWGVNAIIVWVDQLSKLF